MNFFDNIKAIYQKNRKLLSEECDTQLCITLNKWLTFDRDNLSTVKKLLPYLFFIKPEHYRYLLYFFIPFKYKIPFFKKIEKIKQKENKLYNKIQYVLGWSNKELEFNLPLLDKLVQPKEKYWKTQLGIK